MARVMGDNRQAAGAAVHASQVTIQSVLTQRREQCVPPCDHPFVFDSRLASKGAPLPTSLWRRCERGSCARTTPMADAHAGIQAQLRAQVNTRRLTVPAHGASVPRSCPQGPSLALTACKTLITDYPTRAGCTS